MEHQENIVVMGGSFNPPTIAHLKLVRAAMDALEAEKGYLVPVSHAYLKRKMVRAGCGHLCIPVETRLRMLRAMTAEDARLRIDEAETREPSAVTPRIMERIQALHPAARIWFVAGEDKLDLLDTLTRKWALLPRFGAVVFARGGFLERQIAENEALSSCRGAIAVVPPPDGIEGVSSTAVRAHLFDPDAVAAMLHPAVLAMVRQLKAEDFPEEILAFRDEYAFLSNDFPAPVLYQGITYPCAESAFQASKTADPALQAWFAQAGAEKAKQKGGRLTPQAGWEEAQDDIMREIVRLKFTQNPVLREKLLATGSRRLINGVKGKKAPRWGVDTVTWEGENRLGVVLTALRNEWKTEGDS